MADLLGEVDVNIPSRRPPKIIKSEIRRKTRPLSPPTSQESKRPLHKKIRVEEPAPMLNTPPLERNLDDEIVYMGGMDDDAMLASDPVPSSPTANAVERKTQHGIRLEEEEDDLLEVAQAIGDHKIKASTVNMSGTRDDSCVPVTCQLISHSSARLRCRCISLE